MEVVDFFLVWMGERVEKWEGGRRELIGIE